MFVIAITVNGFSQTKSTKENNLASTAKNKQIDKKSNEIIDVSPNVRQLVKPFSNGEKTLFDLQFTHSLTSRGTGIETDGNYFYLTNWSSGQFYRYNLTGSFVDSFTVTGAANIRDLAYDGTYFYGGAAANLIYKMDFTSHTLVSTITGPAGLAVRHIAYDPVNDAFWCGNWDDDIRLISKTGTTLQTISSATHGIADMYGSAYDNYSSGGPYLWLYTQSNNGNDLYQLDLTTGLQTGTYFDLTTVVTTTGIAGGCFISNKITPGTSTLGGLIQNEQIWGLELTKSANNDLSPTVLIYPTSTDILTSSDTITVRVANFDTVAHFNIPISYEIDGGLAVNDTIFDTIAGGANIDFSFAVPYDFSIPGHIYNVVIYTAYSLDSIYSNDTLIATVSNIFDVGTYSIDMFPIYPEGNTIPQATVKNFGTCPTTFDVTMEITGGYTSTKSVTDLAGGATIQVSFDPWNATIGTYDVLTYTILAYDSLSSNDTLTMDSIVVMDLTKVYCYVAYDPTSTIPNGPAYTFLEYPSIVISLDDQSSENFIPGGTWGYGNLWYGAVNNNLITIDTLTGVRDTIGVIGFTPTGIAYTPLRNTIYGIYWDNTYSYLYRISTYDGQATLVGTINDQLLINLASTGSDSLYAVSITDDQLYYIDISTGTPTAIGNVGFDAGYAQSMDFDHNTQTMYMAAYNVDDSQGELRSVDLTTGVTTLIDAFENGSEITCLAIPFNFVIDTNDIAATSITSPVTSNELTSAEQIDFLVTNNSPTDLFNIPVGYILNGGAPVTDTIFDTVTAGSSYLHTFSTLADLSVVGSYTIIAYTAYPGDPNNINDTIQTIVDNTYGIYCSAAGQCDEYISNVQFGSVNNSSSCTGYSDFTSFSASINFLDSVAVTVTNGAAWAEDECGIWVDWNGDGDFTDTLENITVNNSIGLGPYDAMIKIPVGTSFGDKRMRVRISWIVTPDPCENTSWGEVEDYTLTITDTMGIDAGVYSITAPTSGSGLTATEQVKVTIKNYGTQDINSGLSVSFIVNGGAPVTESVPTAIAAGSTLAYTFTGTADLSTLPSSNTIITYTTLAGDMFSTNDTLTAVITNDYCAASGGCDEYISNVTFSNIDNDSDCEGYEDYTSIIGNLGLHETKTITITNGNSYAEDQCRIWIDWNNDGDFIDAGETKTVTGSPGEGPYTASISVPNGIGTGDYRMRIRIAYNATPTPCGTTTYGEVEDYTISVFDDSGLDELTLNENINVYPNPAKNVLNISANGIITNVRIFNTIGQLIEEVKTENNFISVNTADYTTGIYFIEITTGNGKVTEKLNIIK